MNTFSDFNFDFNLDVMKQDLNRVEQKPGQSDTNRADKYVILPSGEGTTTLRILPADTPRGRYLPYASARLHYINKRGYHCLREVQDGRWRGDCPVCSYYSYLYEQAKNAKTEEEANDIKQLARSIKPIERYYYNVIQRKFTHPETHEQELNKGVLILSVGKSIHSRILRAFVGNEKFDEKPLGNIAHPKTGRDFKIIKQLVRSDGQEYPNYDASRFEEESSLGSAEEMKRWLNSLWDLEAERTENLKTYEELEEVVDVLQGKKQVHQGFDPDKYDLPKDLASSNSSIVEVNSKVEVESTKPKASSKSKASAVEDVPFGLDLDDSSQADSDWVKDLQKAINASG